MKVNHLDDYDTHAVIGGKNVVEFKMAQTAEFFTILSSTLYSNKPLAVVREVLCNAWDSHIVSESTDKAVNITLTDSNLVIRDFGKGIHPDNMQDIYCTYGNSTKANDGNQTGGFGLGSKAPFAYSDHFTVTSCHEGIRTVYAISRGSTLTQGKPDMRIMVQIPTTETGLEVNIPIKSIKDKETFEQIVKQIASLGEMNVLLNGTKIEIVPISQSKNNLFITKVKLPQNHSRLQVRYGNVVYPIPQHDDYNDNYKAILNELDNIPSEYGYSHNKEWNLIIQAPPNTISVTPSRESLSMTETSINSIKDLLAEAKSKLNLNSDEFTNLLISYIDKKIDKYWLEGTPNKLLTNLQNNIDGDYDIPDHLTSIEEIAELYIARSRELPPRYHFQEVQDRLQSLIDNGYRRKQDLYRFQRILKREANVKFDRYSIRHTSFFRDQIIRPIIKSIIKHPILKLENMFITQNKEYSERNPLSVTFKPINKVNPKDKDRNSLLQGVVVLSSGKLAYDEFYKNKIFGADTGQYVYITPRNMDHRLAAIQHFEKLGFLVIDFITEYENRPKSTIFDVLAAPAKPKIEGLITLQSLLRPNSHESFKRNGHRDDKHPHIRIVNPEFIFQPYKLSGSEWEQKFFEFGDDVIGKKVVNLIGSKGGIVVNEKQYDHYLKKGARNGYEYLVENISKEMLTNPRIRSYLEFTHIDEKLPEGLRQLLDMADHSHVLKTKYNLPQSLTSEDRVYLDIYNHIKYKDRYISGGWYGNFKTLIKQVDEIKPSTHLYGLIELFNKSKMSALINWDDIKTIMVSKPTMPDRIKLEMLIISILNP